MTATHHAQKETLKTDLGISLSLKYSRLNLVFFSLFKANVILTFNKQIKHKWLQVLGKLVTTPYELKIQLNIFVAIYMLNFID